MTHYWFLVSQNSTLLQNQCHSLSGIKLSLEDEIILNLGMTFLFNSDDNSIEHSSKNLFVFAVKDRKHRLHDFHVFMIKSSS